MLNDKLPEIKKLKKEMQILRKQARKIVERGEAHEKADKILCQICRDHGYGEVIDLYEKIEKWYA